MLGLLFKLIKILALLILPFILLIRGSVFLHEQYGLFSWLSLVGGIGMCALVMVLYFSVFYGRITGRLGSFGAIKRRALIAFICVLFYSLNGILFISSGNMKNEALHKEVSQLHPILRLSISTLIYIDKDLIITDAARVPEDYRKMGLPTKNHSLHYKQSDGYSHAIDLRTNGRSSVRNFLIRTYFWLMGFNTLRHVGTDDHLHISLMSHDRPGAI